MSKGAKLLRIWLFVCCYTCSCRAGPETQKTVVVDCGEDFNQINIEVTTDAKVVRAAAFNQEGCTFTEESAVSLRLHNDEGRDCGTWDENSQTYTLNLVFQKLQIVHIDDVVMTVTCVYGSYEESQYRVVVTETDFSGSQRDAPGMLDESLLLPATTIDAPEIFEAKLLDRNGVQLQNNTDVKTKIQIVIFQTIKQPLITFYVKQCKFISASETKLFAWLILKDGCGTGQLFETELSFPYADGEAKSPWFKAENLNVPECLVLQCQIVVCPPGTPCEPVCPFDGIYMESSFVTEGEMTITSEPFSVKITEQFREPDIEVTDLPSTAVTMPESVDKQPSTTVTIPERVDKQPSTTDFLPEDVDKPSTTAIPEKDPSSDKYGVFIGITAALSVIILLLLVAVVILAVKINQNVYADNSFDLQFASDYGSEKEMVERRRPALKSGRKPTQHLRWLDMSKHSDSSWEDWDTNPRKTESTFEPSLSGTTYQKAREPMEDYTPTNTLDRIPRPRINPEDVAKLHEQLRSGRVKGLGSNVPEASQVIQAEINRRTPRKGTNWKNSVTKL